MKPLLLTAVGRTISTAPLGRRGDDVEVRCKCENEVATARVFEIDNETALVEVVTKEGCSGLGPIRIRPRW